MIKTTRYAIAKLNNENYLVWKYKIELLLIKKSTWDVINEGQASNNVSFKVSSTNGGMIEESRQARATIGLLVEVFS